MSTPHVCPRCAGDKQINDTPCPTCGGEGVVWDRMGGITRVAGDVVVEGNVIASGYRDLMSAEQVFTIDITAPEGGNSLFPNLSYETYSVAMTVEEPDPQVHPERKRALDLLNTLPEDMPVLILTPRTVKEMMGSRQYAKFLRAATLPDAELEDTVERMGTYYKMLRHLRRVDVGTDHDTEEP